MVFSILSQNLWFNSECLLFTSFSHFLIFIRFFIFCHFVMISPTIWPANFPLTFSTLLIIASCTLEISDYVLLSAFFFFFFHQEYIFLVLTEIFVMQWRYSRRKIILSWNIISFITERGKMHTESSSKAEGTVRVCFNSTVVKNLLCINQQLRKLLENKFNIHWRKTMLLD